MPDLAKLNSSEICMFLHLPSFVSSIFYAHIERNQKGFKKSLKIEALFLNICNLQAILSK